MSADASNHIDVKKIADLARLELDADEIARFQAECEAIVGYVETLRAVDVSGVEPTAHATRITNVYRADAARTDAAPREAYLANAPEQDEDQFRVPKVVDDGGGVA